MAGPKRNSPKAKRTPKTAEQIQAEIIQASKDLEECLDLWAQLPWKIRQLEKRLARLPSARRSAERREAKERRNKDIAARKKKYGY